ncbi:MAG: site-specific integrase [Planctomycetaceae bacterium]|nr:site-specific integrase [Planctomycetales bacterium]MCB9924348.1 site-specific integrase [Planctomycetaceae bacterium]
MASIEQRGSSFRIVFRYDGRKYSRSLHTSDRDAAAGSLARLEDNLRRAELGTLVIPEGADVATFLLSDGKRTAKREHSPIRTLAELMDAYFDGLPENSLEDNTLYLMKLHRRHLERLLGQDLRITALQLADLQQYVNKRSQEKGLRGKKVQPTTIRKELTTLSGMWSWATAAGIVQQSLPMRRLRFAKVAEKPRFQTWQEIERRIRRGDLTESEQADLWDCLFLTKPEISELLTYVEGAARHPFIYPMFVLAAHTGARRSEILRSELDDIDLRSRWITIREKKRQRGAFTTRMVPISPELHSVLDQWFDEHPGGKYTFCLPDHIRHSRKCRNGGGQLTVDEATDHFNRTLEGSRWEKLRGWHVFRHSFCSNCAAASVDQRLINSWVGHQTEAMVRRYRHLIPSQQIQEIERVFAS